MSMRAVGRGLVILSLLLTGVSLVLSSYSIYQTRRLASATRSHARFMAAAPAAR